MKTYQSGSGVLYESLDDCSIVVVLLTFPRRKAEISHTFSSTVLLVQERRPG